MDALWKDFSFGLRVLRANSGSTIIALLALVLGIGANTAIFSVVNAVLLRPLPFHDPDRLAMVYEKSPHTGKINSVNPQNFADWQKRNRSFEKMAAYCGFTLTANIVGEGAPEEIPTDLATRDFFSILGVKPALGRDFLPQDDASRANVAIISDGLWRRRYGADQGVIGRKLNIDKTAVTVIGVLPRDFRFPNVKPDIWQLLHIDAGAARSGRSLSGIARLRPGVNLSQAQGEMNVIAAGLAQEHPDFDTGWGASVLSMHESFTGELRTPLLVLLSAVGLVLLIACANVANLMLMRSTARSHEIAIRTSLGATGGRIVRQLLIESGILGGTGGLLALLLALWAKDFLLAMLPESISLSSVNRVSIDTPVLLFTATLSLFTTLLFGLVPALQAARTGFHRALKETGRGVSESLSRNRLRSALVAGEIALALMLLTGAALLIQSFFRLERVAPGFETNRVLSMHVSLTGSRYANPHQAADGMEEILTRVEHVPGVVSAGSVLWAPLSGLESATTFRVAGRPVPKPGQEPVTAVSVVTPDYFSTMSIPLIQGRVFSRRDRADSAPVVLISQALARVYFQGMDPIGQRLFISWERKVPYEIVGVMGDVKHDGLDQNAMPAVYFADAQEPSLGGTLMIRTMADPMKLAPVIEQVIHGYDKDQPVADIRPLDAIFSKSIARPRFQSVLLASFAGLALLLAVIGIFGVMSYSVLQRTREIGIRVALGASQTELLRLVVGQGTVLAVIGIATGLAGALALTRYLRTLLFETSPTDPLTFVAVSLILCMVAVAASYFPARKATRVDPIEALRYE
jgi:putative ABC transport system permease protein